MTSYLIYPTETAALDRSHEAYVTDTQNKLAALGASQRRARNSMAGSVTQYRWAIDVGADGQTALVIDGDEELLTPEEIAASVPDLPDGEGENWYKPPPDTGSIAPTEPPINEDVPHAYQEGGLLLCTMGNWVDPPPDSYEFQWQVDGLELDGATADELPVTLDDEGKTFACVVTATNAIGSTWIASNDVTVDAAALP
jgi:hypothetical protein